MAQRLRAYRPDHLMTSRWRRPPRRLRAPWRPAERWTVALLAVVVWGQLLLFLVSTGWARHLIERTGW